MGALSLSRSHSLLGPFADTRRPSPSEVNTKHNPRDAKGSDAVLVPTIKAPMTKGPATLPLPPTKDKKVRKSMRGVASIKRRVLTEPSAPPHHVSTRPAGAQDPPPSWVLREHLEWIEQEVTLRVAAALALSKNENTPVARARVVPYKDAGTQVDDAVVLAARASPRVRIEKKVCQPYYTLLLFSFQINQKKF